MKLLFSFSLIVMTGLVAPFSDNFDNGNLTKWQSFGNWSVENGQLTNPTGGNIFYKDGTYTDFTYEADVTVGKKEEKAGLLFRATKTMHWTSKDIS